MVRTPDEVYLDLKQACEERLGLKFLNGTALPLGLLNLKWKVETDQGMYVLKHFSRERYMRYDVEKVAREQQMALREQIRQFEYGTPCPRLLTYNGDVIHTSSCGERFVIMEYMRGENLLPGTLNEEQMDHLGRVTAHMHNVFQLRTGTPDLPPKFVPPTIEERLNEWHIISQKSRGNDRVLEFIEQQIRATKAFDLAGIRTSRPGWAHRDLWVDNILFIENHVSAILDFDRAAFDYPELDIARAVLSGSLNGEQFNTGAAAAFVNGYRTTRELSKETLIRSLQLLWYLESVWWIGPELNRSRYQEVQFENEMRWLAANLVHLSSLFGDL